MHKRAASVQPDFERIMDKKMKEASEGHNSGKGSDLVGRITMVSKTGLKYKMDFYSKEQMDNTIN